MAITPNSIVRLLNVPLDKTQEHQIRFASRSAQSTYFAGKTIKVYSNLTHTRKDNMIRIPAHIDTLWNVNYVMYDNADMGSRWFYAFIDRMEYISEAATAVYIKTDVYQTWMLDCTFKNSFVIREHVSDDTIGLHTVPESVELGNYVLEGISTANIKDLAIVVAVTEVWNGTDWVGAGGNMYNGIYSGVRLFYSTQPGAITNFLDKYLELSGVPLTNKVDAVVAIWMVPQALIGTSATVAEVPQSAICTPISVNAPSLPSDLDGYTPKNNKLLTHPYCMLTADNSAGVVATYKYEDFESTTPAFDVFGGVMPNPSYKAIPSNMKNRVLNISHMEYGITIAGFPMCTWSTDSFLTWLGQNSGSLGISAGGSLLAIIGGAAAGSPLAMAGGVLGAASSINQMTQQLAAPDHLNGSVNSPSANVAYRQNDIYFKAKTIKEEYAKIIDEYFTMYGYKVNRVKTPELSSRPGWNFVQTSGANIIGGIPQEDLTELKNIFDKGVTLWHSAANVGDYSGSNDIV